ncbi:DUF6069 family protein [Isoptericola sp. NEAU-Y5]|uniref:DUF6069 family protein n=1 Tax=Isoptericola luteus TaxID=2879484 RepID=A0ABS7ZGU5_9MICO|nr:DUF6069 family protein [Isoptericola sp. NEAU-Y5]MCA5894255.1 DUF6069 family protein [Isoptericola sp. NEAU-Y5]
MWTTEASSAPRTTSGAGAPRTARRRRWSGPRAVVPAAMLTGALVFLVGTLAGVDPQVRAGTGTLEVTISLVLGASLTAALAGWGVRSLLARASNGGRRTWLTLCAAVLLVSLLGPLGAANGGAMLLLALEHLTVGTVIALGLAGTHTWVPRRR